MNKPVDFIVQKIAILFCQWGNVLILIMALINLIIFIKTKSKINKANDSFNPRSDKVNGVSASMEWNREQISDLKKERKSLLNEYTWYANITAIFPLLGILGTVAALVTYSDETMMDNFMVALGTTLLGVFFAIIYKAIDAILSASLDLFFEDTDHVIREFDHRKEAQE